MILNDNSSRMVPSHIPKLALSHNLNTLLLVCLPHRFPICFPSVLATPQMISTRKYIPQGSRNSLLRCGLPNWRGGYDCPCDRNPPFSHVFVRLNNPFSIFLQNPLDTLKSVEEIRGLSLQEIMGLCNRIQRYSASICGSNSFFRLRHRELQALMEHKGHPTLWFTLSYVGHHWKYLL